MAVKINSLTIENVKRIKAVKIEPTKDGLTVIGGRNGQGKTSVLDSIAWALGGNTYKPSEPKRRGSAVDPELKITMSNGLIVERKGKNSALKVTDPSGQKAGQALLDEFIEKLALDLPKFLNAGSKEKAKTLLKIIGVEEELNELNRQENERYNKRHAIGQIADQKAKFAKEQPYFPEAPETAVSAMDLINEQQEILKRNGRRLQWKDEHETILRDIEEAKQNIYVTEGRLKDLQEHLRKLEAQEETARRSPEELEMESTKELEESIASIEEINKKVQANADKLIADHEAQEYKAQYDELTEEIESIRKKRNELLNEAGLPLPELAVENGEITYKGQQWDNMSGAEQMKVATAIIRKLNPECGFILLDKLEQMDVDTLKEFGEWLEEEGLQAIATRVSTGADGDCTIIIEDGQAVESRKDDAPKQNKQWQKGVF